jgi:hypothetical protein
MTTALAFALATSASAGVTCQTIGAYTYCNSGGGGHVTCTKIGNYTYCN